MHLPNTVSSRDLARHEWPARVACGVLALGSLVLAAQTLLSLRWAIHGDAAALHAITFLIDRHGFVPYRDIFEVSLPLSYWLHLAIGRALGFGDLAFRAADVAFLGALLFVTWRLMRPLGQFVAWAAVLTFGFLYQSFGPLAALQRDFTGLLPAAAAVWLAGRSGRWRYLVIGGLFGLAAGIKPHFVIGLPPVLVYALATDGVDGLRNPATRRAVGEAIFLTGVGLVVSLVPPLLWVWRVGGLPSFISQIANWLPIYNRLSGDLVLMGTADRIIEAYEALQSFGGKAALWMLVALGAFFGLFERSRPAPQRRLITLLLVLTFAYVLYEVVAGKFWYYHWLPFYYFAACVGALVLLPLEDRAPAGRQWFALAALALGLFLTLRPAPDFDRQLRGLPPEPVAGGRAVAMTDFLRRELRPGDTVQPIDGIMGGSTTALREAGAVLATPYMLQEQFHHNVSNPYVQGLRRDFIARLEAAPPRFLVLVPRTPDPAEVDTAPFTELDRFIATRYRIALEGDGFVIYERGSSEQTAPGS